MSVCYEKNEKNYIRLKRLLFIYGSLANGTLFSDDPVASTAYVTRGVRERVSGKVA